MNKGGLRNITKIVIPGSIINKRRKKIAIKKNRKVAAEWLDNGEAVPIPHQCKQLVIQEFQKKCKIKNFIETGTYEGQMVEAQIPFFKSIISIELSNELYALAVEKFKSKKQVQLIQGDSGKELFKVVPNLKGPAIFWLDGHYSAGKTSKADKETPILEELKAIFSSQFKNIILIDDARCFTGTNDYPTINSVKELVSKYNRNLKTIVDKDIIQIYY